MKYRLHAAALFMVAVLLLQVGSLPPAQAEEKVRYYSGWSYVIRDGEIILQRHTSGGTGLIVPAGINGYPVTALGEGALENDTVLKYVTLPESIRSIGRWAFMGCTSLAKVTFNEKAKLESIGDAAFLGCKSLAKVTLPTSLKSLGMSVFQRLYRPTQYLCGTEKPQLSSPGLAWYSVRTARHCTHSLLPGKANMPFPRALG